MEEEEGEYVQCRSGWGLERRKVIFILTLQVYNKVMPQWMDMLVGLRSQPGKMESLQQQLM